MRVTTAPARPGVRALAFAACVAAMGFASGGLGGCSRGGAACPPGTKGTQCRWERERRASQNHSQTSLEADFAAEQEPLGQGGVWGNVERVLMRGQEALAQGYVGEEIMNALVGVCDVAPQVQDTDHGLAWSCPLAEPITMYGGSFDLEVGEHGIVSLTALNLTASSAERFLVVATNRWKQPRWCLEKISKPDPSLNRAASGPSSPPPSTDAAPDAGDRAGSTVPPESSVAPLPATTDDAASRASSRVSRSWRCALPDRLALVAAQFPQAGGEDGGDLWQVSLAIVGTR